MIEQWTQTKGDDMKLSEIKAIALSLGVKPGKSGKSELIRAIQRAEDNYDCFATGSADECGQQSCLWREDCKAYTTD